MNNTQQAGETAKEFLREKNILGKDCKYFIIDFSDGREVDLTDLLIEYAAYLPTPAPDAVEAKAEKKIIWEVIWKAIEHFQEMRESPEDTITYNELEAELYGLFDKPLAGHAEGQKATVEAKSAGVWVNISKRLPGIWQEVKWRSALIDIPDERQWLEVILDGYSHVKSSLEWLDETPTSHAEGEKGAVGFAGSPWPFHGYAPGHYQNTCVICKKDMIADKLCFMCLECAVKTAKGIEVNPVLFAEWIGKERWMFGSSLWFKTTDETTYAKTTLELYNLYLTC